jgi:hypothetical protein
MDQEKSIDHRRSRARKRMPGRGFSRGKVRHLNVGGKSGRESMLAGWAARLAGWGGEFSVGLLFLTVVGLIPWPLQVLH